MSVKYFDRAKTIKLEIYKLQRNVKKRFDNLQNLLDKKGIQSPALSRLNKDIEENKFNWDYKNLSESELQSHLRQLKYYNSLKTSYVKGANKYNEFINNVFPEEVPKDTIELMNQMFNIMVEEYEILKVFSPSELEELLIDFRNSITKYGYTNFEEIDRITRDFIKNRTGIEFTEPKWDFQM